MPTFGQVQLPLNANPLASYFGAQIGQNAVDAGTLANQTSQQDLADRATLRGLAPAIASGDPSVAGQLVSLSAPTQAHTNYASMHADQRAQLGNTLAVTGSLSGAILSAPPDQRAALYQQWRPTMVQAGAVQMPEQYPGDDWLNSHRIGATTVQEQLQLLQNMPTTDPNRTPLSAPPGPRVGPGGVMQTGPSGAMSQNSAPDGDPTLPGVVHAQESGGSMAPGIMGDNGQAAGPMQVHPAALADVNQRLGTNYTHAQLASDPRIGKLAGDTYLQIQRERFGRDDYALGAYNAGPGAMQRAIASGQGIAGLPPAAQQYVADGMRRLAAGRSTQVASVNGTAGIPQTATDAGGAGGSPYDAALARLRAQQAPAPSSAAAPDAPAPTAAPDNSDVVNLDRPEGAQGLPVGTRFSVAGGPVQVRAAAPPAPVPQPAPAPAPQPTAAPVPAAAPAPPTQPAAARTNALYPVGAASTAAPPAQNGLLPVAAPSAQTPALPPGSPPVGGQVLYRNNMPIPAQVPGYVLTRMPDGSTGMARIPGAPPKIKSTPVGGFMINTDENTAQEVSRFPIPDASRTVPVQTAGGTQMFQSGHPVGTPIPFSGRPEQESAYKSDIQQAQSLTAAAQNAQASMPRLNEMAALVPQLATGPGAEVKAKGAAILESMGVPADKIKAFTGMSSGSAAQEFVKLGITAAGAASKADVGANNGIESVRLYQSANPGLALLPDANKRVTNMMRVASQATQDYAQGALQHFGQSESAFLNGGNYTPLTTFNRQWQAQNNPQVYAAATGILNGDSFEKWREKLTKPEDAMRAAQIVARIDPAAMVPVKGGMRPVRDIVGQQAP